MNDEQLIKVGTFLFDIHEISVIMACLSHCKNELTSGQSDKPLKMVNDIERLQDYIDGVLYRGNNADQAK